MSIVTVCGKFQPWKLRRGSFKCQLENAPGDASFCKILERCASVGFSAATVGSAPERRAARRACGCSGRAVAVPRGAGLTPPCRALRFKSHGGAASCPVPSRVARARSPWAVSCNRVRGRSQHCFFPRGQPVLEASEVLPAVSTPQDHPGHLGKRLWKVLSGREARAGPIVRRPWRDSG